MLPAVSAFGRQLSPQLTLTPLATDASQPTSRRFDCNCNSSAIDSIIVPQGVCLPVRLGDLRVQNKQYVYRYT